MNVCIIPARGSSKRIPRKNIKAFGGIPIIAWSIQAAIKSACFERVVVSTDDEEIADISRSYGAQVPFLRPKQLAGDFVPTRPVIQHAIKMLEQTGDNIKYVCCIQATAPLIDISDIQAAYIRLEQQKTGFVFSACAFPSPVQRAFYIDEDRSAKMFSPENIRVRSQDLTDAYYDAGQFYWGQRDDFLMDKTVFEMFSTPFLIAREKAQDIDTEDDWQFAERLFELNKSLP